MSDYIPDPLLDEEVNEALKKNDPNLIWAMTGILAVMDTEEYAINRSAIKARFGNVIPLTLLDKAVAAKRNAHAAHAAHSPSPRPDKATWEKLLHANEHGDPKSVLVNADIALRNFPEWQGVLAFDEFKQKVRVIKTPPIGGQVPRDWSDTDDTNAAIWMQEQKIYVGREITGSAIQSVAMDSKIHAVRDYLNALTWDGTHRIDTWLTTFMGVPNSPVTRMIGSRWLISAIARIMSPGCQCDYMMVLEGVQGTKKSTALKILASQEWFCDHTPDLHDKDSQIQLSGSWIIEWAELDSLRKSEVTAVKQFLSRRVEKFRPPYGRYVVEIPRQCVFAGTTNELAWNKDDTGARRFWPAACERIDSDGLERQRDQLWAESLSRYTDGAIWWPDTAEEHAMLTLEQDARIERDSWHSEIETYLSSLLNAHTNRITSQEILSKCIGLSLSAHGHSEKLRVGRVMKVLNWEYIKERIPETDSFFNGYERR